MPAVLVEAGFLDHPEDNRIFDEQFDQIAQGIADGILTTFSQLKKETEEKRYYQVQVGAYRERPRAEFLVKGACSQGFPAFLVYDDGLYKVRVGAFCRWTMESGWSRE